ncbi:TraB/GumN family protein [Candidatus Woesearchaeota archaeon]|nr:TraB/GumN family protein [Candidatus Woesearchaeota archaeon]
MAELPFLWEVKKNGAISHLIGTAHPVADINIIEAAKRLVDKARVLYVETPEDFKLQEHHISLLNGQTIEDILTRGELKMVNSFFREHYQVYLTPEEVQSRVDAIKKQKLWYLESVAMNIVAYGSEEIKYWEAKKQAAEILVSILTQQFYEEETQKTIQKLTELKNIIKGYEAKDDKNPATLDNAIRRYANSKGVSIIGLDTPDEFVKIYDSVSSKTQRQTLLGVINAARKKNVFDQNEIQAYRDGNIKYMVSTLNPRGLNPRGRADKEYFAKACHGRTELWHLKTQEDIKQGETLIAIGIHHILTPPKTQHGYLAKLQRDGYQIRRL